MTLATPDQSSSVQSTPVPSTPVHSTSVQSARVPPSAPGRRRRFPRGLVWLVGAVTVIVLIVVTVGLLSSSASNNREDDPRSALPGGTSALAQLLTDEGVAVVPVDSVEAAAGQAGPATTLVVANADRLSADEAGRLLAARPGRVILLGARARGLRAFGLQETTTTSGDDGVSQPGCDDPIAARSGPILLERAVGYQSSTTPALACYRVGDGWSWVRPAGTAVSIDLVAGGVSNRDLGEQGNAAFGMNVFGTQPTLVWLMAERRSADVPAGERPTLLPSWWPIAVVQLVLALVVVGIWRGRRLGPIMVEPLPVRVRSSETVVGHGRLYFRIGARDRAAESLRAGVRERLGRRFGHRFDPDALVATLADQTGRPGPEVWQLLYGPPPDTDDALVALARALDELEQEVRR